MNPAFQNQSFSPKTLNDLSPGDCGVIAGLTCQGALRRRLLDLGFVAGAAVACVGASPHKDPKAYLIRGAQRLPEFTEYPNAQIGYGALCVRESLPGETWK